MLAIILVTYVNKFYSQKIRIYFMINRRDNNIVNIFSYILNVLEDMRKKVYDVIISPIHYKIKAEKQLQ